MARRKGAGQWGRSQASRAASHSAHAITTTVSCNESRKSPSSRLTAIKFSGLPQNTKLTFSYATRDRLFCLPLIGLLSPSERGTEYLSINKNINRRQGLPHWLCRMPGYLPAPDKTWLDAIDFYLHVVSDIRNCPLAQQRIQLVADGRELQPIEHWPQVVCRLKFKAFFLAAAITISLRARTRTRQAGDAARRALRALRCAGPRYASGPAASRRRLRANDAGQVAATMMAECRAVLCAWQAISCSANSKRAPVARRRSTSRSRP